MAGGNFLPLGDPRDQIFIRRVVRASISSHRAEVTHGFVGNTKPFIVDIDFCQFPPALAIQRSEEDTPGPRCIHMHPPLPPPGWTEAWERAKDGLGLLVVRNTIPVGRGVVVFTQVMPSHPFHDENNLPKTSVRDDTTMGNTADDQDDIFIASSEDNPGALCVTHECRE